MEILESQLQELQEFIPVQELLKSEVSMAPVGWHIAHCLLVINTIVESLKRSQPDNYKKTFSFWKTAVFILKRIPRGKAQSPASVIPPQEIKEAFLKKQIVHARNNILNLNNLPEKAFFKHPYFSHLNRNETKKFIEIHTEHHLKIIREVYNQR